MSFQVENEPKFLQRVIDLHREHRCVKNFNSSIKVIEELLNFLKSSYVLGDPRAYLPLRRICFNVFYAVGGKILPNLSQTFWKLQREHRDME